MQKFLGLISVLITGTAMLVTHTALAAKPPTTTIFTNGIIHVDAVKTVENLAVRDGRVLAVDIEPGEYKDAEIVDLKGAALYPGFNDSHVHISSVGAVAPTGVSLLGCSDADSMAEALAERAKTTPEGSLILGLGFSLEDYDKWSLADLAKIDAATGKRPAFLADQFGHNAIVNSAAMKLSKLTPSSPVPLGGKMGIENGRLTGMMRESAMIIPWDATLRLIDRKTIKAGMSGLAQRWASLGYTAIVDLMGGPGARTMYPEIYRELEKEGALPLRVNYMYTIFNLKDVDEARKFVGKDTELVRFIGCKIFVDGAFAAGQAWTSWENKQGNHGLQEIYTDDIGGAQLNLNRIVARVEEYGMNMHYHTQGDLAIEAVLDALDKVKAEKGKIKGVHTLIHLAFPTDEQISRIKGFGKNVVLTVQPGFWPVESKTAYYYGDWADKAYPIKELIDAGISVGFSTDFSVSPPEYTPAQVVIGVAATGGGNPKIHTPVTVEDALRAFTLGSANTTGRTDTGRLVPGAWADMVVYDKSFSAIPPEKITAEVPRLLSTWVAGKKVFSAP